MTYEEFARKYEIVISGSTIRMLPRLVCEDGFSMSVQASENHYCFPSNSVGPWESYEVGYPSEKVDDLMVYAEDCDRPTDTVYANVPAQVVELVCANHGGIVGPDDDHYEKLKVVFT